MGHGYWSHPQHLAACFVNRRLCAKPRFAPMLQRLVAFQPGATAFTYPTQRKISLQGAPGELGEVLSLLLIKCARIALGLPACRWHPQRSGRVRMGCDVEVHGHEKAASISRAAPSAEGRPACWHTGLTSTGRCPLPVLSKCPNRSSALSKSASPTDACPIVPSVASGGEEQAAASSACP